MAVMFNADEVLAMAEDIETNGAAFYRKAASMHKKHADFLTALAKMEDVHKATFAKMRKALPPRMREETAADPYMEASLYIKDVSDSHKGEGSPAITASLTGRESLIDILQIAVVLEQRSIAFYMGLRDMVSEKLGKGRIDDIVAEEKKHVVVLARELKKVTGI